VIEHVRLLPSCTGVVLYIADKILEQEIDSFSESLVVLLVVTPQKAAQYLDKLNFITEDHLSDNFRIIINCSEFGPILTQIHERYHHALHNSSSHEVHLVNQKFPF
jgi:hypothetical protein